MSGIIRDPNAELMSEVFRIRNRILDAVSDETNFSAVAQASLFVWAGIVKADGGVSNAQARDVALQTVDYYFPRGELKC